KHMAATVARTPDADSLAIDLGLYARPRNRMAVVAHLLNGIDLQARLTAARAEIAIVVNQRGESRGGKYFGEAVEVHFLDRGKPVRHHDAWREASGPLRQIEPSAQNPAFGLYFDVTPHKISPGAMIDDSEFGRKGLSLQDSRQRWAP